MDKPKKNSDELILPESFDQMDDMSRRHFLEYALKLTALVAAAPLMKPSLAQAQTAIDAPTRFVNFFIGGGSCQLGSYLCPTANIADLSTLNANTWKVPGLATSFRPSSAANASKENVDHYFPVDANDIVTTNYGNEAIGSQPIYHTRIPINAGNYMPILWASQIPVGATGTSTASMKSLIQTNCALIYGLESSPAHGIAMNMLLDPEPGAFTVGGHIASLSTPSFFSAIGNNRGVKPFKSPKGSAMRQFRGDPYNSGPAKDVLNSLLQDPTETGTLTRKNWLNAISTKMMNALDSIRITNMNLKPGISDLYKLLKDAKEAVDLEKYNLVVTDFSNTLAKYEGLRNRIVAMAPNSIQGITDAVSATANITRETLRKMEATDSTPQKNPLLTKTNPVQTFTGLNVSSEMSYIFAFAEVALRNDLTHVLQLGFGNSMVSLQLGGSSPIATDNTANRNHNFDNHNNGVIANLCWGSLFYYAFNTMLYEFRRNLQGITGTPSSAQSVTVEIRSNDSPLDPSTPATPSPNPWRDTVILVNTEFPRDQQKRGTGSDHGYGASCVALISGRLPNSFKIYGKTTYSTDPNHPGAWGQHSIQMKMNNKYINTRDIGASIAGLFVRTTAHKDLQTLILRSHICFGLDANGNITINLPLYSLEPT